MEVYNCKVLVGGSRDCEVRKQAIVAAEITMLRHIHGDDSILEIVHVGTTKIPNAQVREMLALTYAEGKADAPRMREVFGPPGAPLPIEIEGVKLRTKPVDISADKILRWRAPAEVLAPASDEPSFAD